MKKNDEETKELILKAAETEFAQKGFYGARVDAIAALSGINKRFIYSWFTNKEELYKVVLHEAYKKMARTESEIFVEYDNCEDAIRRVIKMYFTYMENNPTYVSLILWENLNKGEYIKSIDLSDIKNKVYDYIYKIIKEGKEKGDFRDDVSESQTILSIMTLTFSYFSNRYTLPKLMDDKVDFARDVDERINNVTEMILKYIKK